MNINTISYYKILSIFSLMGLVGNTLYAQQIDNIKVGGKFVGLSFGPSQTKIENNGIASFSNFNVEKKYAMSGSVEFGYYLTQHIGISAGIGYESYNTGVSLSAYQNKFNTIDSEKEAYEMRVTGNGLSEKQKISYLTVPVCLNLRLPIGQVFGLFLKTGMQMALTLNKSYTGNGTFSYKGYYPKYNVLLENLPAYGFENNRRSSVNGQLAVKPVTVFVLAAAGFDLFIKEKYQMAIGACYNKSISEVSAYSSNVNYQLSPAAEQINSFLGGSEKASVHSAGIYLTVRYFMSK
jgi:hypothetical protein